MKKLVVALVTLLVMLLPRLVDAQEPSGNGTVPPHTVWLPVIESTDKCSVSNGEYIIYYNRQGDPFHAIHYRIERFEFFGDSTVVVARDTLLQDVVSEGGVSGIIPGSMYFTLSPNGVLEIGQTYYARMTYTCEGILAQTSVLTVVAKDPFTP